jgi:hypothetical protein
MSQRGIRDALRSIVPNWLANRLGKNTGFKFLWSAALMADVMVQALLEGTRAALPGKGTPTALSYIGQGRGILRGPTEGDASYTARLQSWLTSWQNAGSDEVMLEMMQAFIGGDPSTSVMPVMRIITRAGLFTSIDSAGFTSQAVDVSWNWDTIYNPERVGYWSDFWIVVYISSARWPEYSSLTDTNWVNAWGNAGTHRQWGLGFEITRIYVDGLSSILATWKGAHTYCQGIIFTSDASLFIPGSLGVGGNPDGKWGNYSKYSGGVQVSARTTDTGGGFVRYMILPNGG